MELAGRLRAAGFSRLFLSGDSTAADEFGADPEALAAIVADRGEDALARVIAAELLFARGYPRDRLAEAYAHALTVPSADLPANLWGFLFYAPDADGPLGEHLVACGPSALPELIALLDDETPLLYAGSRDAMLGNSFHYRVKDAAGYFLAKLTGTDVAFSEDPGTRDEELTRLRSAVDGDG